MLCDAFCSHTALPRVKGMHQPRDSAVFSSKQTATATAGDRRATSNSEQAQTVKGGGVGGSSTQLNTFTLCPPRLRPPVSALRETNEGTGLRRRMQGGPRINYVAARPAARPLQQQQTNNRDKGGGGIFRRDSQSDCWVAYLIVALRRAST